MKATRWVFFFVVLAGLLAGVMSCDGQIGNTPGGVGGLGPGGGGPGSGSASGARSLRRLSADQVRAAIVRTTGTVYTGEAEVRDPLSMSGVSVKRDADLLTVYAASLGKPDYDVTVTESLEPGVTFSKFVSDAVRFTCAAAVTREMAGGGNQANRHLLLKASAADNLPDKEAAIRSNIAALILRFWGDVVETNDPEVDSLVEVFRTASTAPACNPNGGTQRAAGSVADGWRAVCIALGTHPKFLVY